MNRQVPNTVSWRDSSGSGSLPLRFFSTISKKRVSDLPIHFEAVPIIVGRWKMCPSPRSPLVAFLFRIRLH